ncbi:MAG: 6-pyruvoyl tetrahydrobiopterin synthase [Proteobacteria bacterium]|nr:6-pyruvoyl tetrahydrobiopterin synthase [Pseudomonadota bacterium]
MSFKYLSTKTYGTDRGLSCCFRQWRANHSHCSLLHGYSIGIKLVFESDTLDEKNWVMDFGGLKAFKAWSEYMFDHTLVVAADDPQLSHFKQLSDVVNMASDELFGLEAYKRGALADLRIVDGVGCEMFAELCFSVMNDIITHHQQGLTWKLNRGKDGYGVDHFEEFKPRYPISKGVRLKSAEVFEHAGNSAIYERVDYQRQYLNETV